LLAQTEIIRNPLTTAGYSAMNEIDEEVEDIVDEPRKPLTPRAKQRQNERREIYRIFLELNHAIKCLKIAREIQSACEELHEGFVAYAYRPL
jgi:hypothetical protein